MISENIGSTSIVSTSAVFTKIKEHYDVALIQEPWINMEDTSSITPRIVVKQGRELTSVKIKIVGDRGPKEY